MNIDLEDIIQKQVNCINVFTLLNIRNRFITVSIYIYISVTEFWYHSSGFT